MKIIRDNKEYELSFAEMEQARKEIEIQWMQDYIEGMGLYKNNVELTDEEYQETARKIWNAKERDNYLCEVEAETENDRIRQYITDNNLKTREQYEEELSDKHISLYTQEGRE